MSSKEEYRRIIENIGTKQRIFVKKDEINNEDEYLCLLALEAILLGKDPQTAQKTLEAVSSEHGGVFLTSIYNEVLLAIGIRTKTNIDELLEIANETLELYPDAVLAKTVKGYVSIRLGNPKSGIDYYLDIIKSFPAADWIYEYMVRSLFDYRAYKEAKEFISKVRSRGMRVQYYLIVLLTSPIFNMVYLASFFIAALFNDIFKAVVIFSVFPITLMVFAIIAHEELLSRIVSQFFIKLFLFSALIVLIKSV